MKRTYVSTRSSGKGRAGAGTSGRVSARSTAGIAAVREGAEVVSMGASADSKHAASLDTLDPGLGVHSHDSSADFQLSGRGATDLLGDGPGGDSEAADDAGTKAKKSSRVRILEAALELFGAQGFEATSVRDLAAVAEVNLAAVNYHFRSKENLRLDALRYGFSPTLLTAQKMHAALLVAKREGTVMAAEDALVQFIHLFVKEVVGPENKHWAMFLRERLNPGPALEMVMREYFDPLGSALGGILKLLLPEHPQDKIHLCITSIIGQCVHIRMAAPTIKFFSGHDASSPEFLDKAALHIAEFSVLAVRGMRELAAKR